MPKARAVGNAVFLEREGNCGDIASWGTGGPQQAEFVAEQINNLFAERDAALAEARQAAAGQRRVVGRHVSTREMTGRGG